jgi:hypothetical protein
MTNPGDCVAATGVRERTTSLAGDAGMAGAGPHRLAVHQKETFLRATSRWRNDPASSAKQTTIQFTRPRVDRAHSPRLDLKFQHGHTILTCKASRGAVEMVQSNFR